MSKFPPLMGTGTVAPLLWLFGRVRATHSRSPSDGCGREWRQCRSHSSSSSFFFSLFHSFAGVVREVVDSDASVRWKSIQFQEVGEDFTRSSGASANAGLRWKLDFNAGNVFYGVFGGVFFAGSVTW